MHLSQSTISNDDDQVTSMASQSWNGWNDGRMIDDCVGALLSYLSLVDKFRLESVSKQWQRKIFWSVRYLRVEANWNGNCLCFVRELNGSRITSNPVNIDVLKSIFRKCHNIECVELIRSGLINRGILTVIANECEFLSHLKIHFNARNSDEGLRHFFLKCGTKLKKLQILGAIDFSCYSNCSNLEEIVLNIENSLIKLNQTHFLKLKSVCGFIDCEQIMSPQFISFCEQYKNQLTSIKLSIRGNVNKETLMRLFIEINHFSKLKYICLDLLLFWADLSSCTFTSNQLNHLKKMNVWKKLSDLKMENIFTNVKSNLQSFLAPFLIASHFNLKSIELVGFKMSTRCTIGDIFPAACPKLKTLILKLFDTPDGFYQDIHLCFPNLTQFYIRGQIEDSSLLFNELASMSQLKSLKITAKKCAPNDDLLQQFITNYSSSLIPHQSLSIVEFNWFRDGVFTLPNLHKIIHFASSIKPSVRIIFFRSPYSWADHDTGTDCASLQETMQQITSISSIPENLTLYYTMVRVITNGKLTYSLNQSI